MIFFIKSCFQFVLILVVPFSYEWRTTGKDAELSITWESDDRLPTVWVHFDPFFSSPFIGPMFPASYLRLVNWAKLFQL
jgi:hypothetical protein